MVLKMKLPMKQKLAIVGVFCLGFGVVIASSMSLSPAQLGGEERELETNI